MIVPKDEIDRELARLAKLIPRPPLRRRLLSAMRRKLGEWLGYERELEVMRRRFVAFNLRSPYRGSASDLLVIAVDAVRERAPAALEVMGETMRSSQVPPGVIVLFLVTNGPEQ